MRILKRSVSVILALLLFVALTPVAEAKAGTPVSNSGTRHEVCTELSAQAQAYYTGIYTFDVVSALPASAADPMNSEMFSRLHTLMTDTVSDTVSYNSLTSYWPKTDANNGSSNPILFYSDELSASFNREHVWPKSRASFEELNSGCDLHHLRPTNADVNSARGSMTMGNVKGVYTSYKTKALSDGTVLWYNTDADVVEVRDNIKGDVARILLYVWCRWQEPNLYEDVPNPVIGPGDSANNGKKVIESLETLLQWMKDDPVDTWEMSRNDQCENVQGNRNVFIDYPEYAWLLFGQDPPANYQTPSGSGGVVSPYTVSAVANNAAWGSVSVSGRTVIAVPNAGYYTESATVSPAGAATLTQNGNIFAVSNLTADCTVTVRFAPKPASDERVYTLVETAPSDWSGQYLIVYEQNHYAMDGSLGTIDDTNNYRNVAEAYANKSITLESGDDTFYFTIEPNGSGYAIKSASGQYIGRSSNSNGLDSSGSALAVTLSMNGSDANIVGSAGAYLRFNNQSGQDRFRFYKSNSYSSQKPVKLYKLEGPVLPDPEPAFYGNSLILSDSLGVRFYLSLPEIDGVSYENSYMTYTITGSGTITERADFDADNVVTIDGAQYHFFTSYINAIQMADSITATFHYTQSGTEKTLEKHYCVTDYFATFDNQIKENPNAYDTKTQNLIRAIADYGHYVQPFLSEQKHWTIGTDYAEMDHYYAEQYDYDAVRAAVAEKAIVREHNDPDILDIGFSLLLDSKTAIRVYFKPAAAYDGPFTATLNGASVTPVKQSDGQYMVEVSGLSAHKLAVMHTIVMTTDHGSATVLVSALSYVNAVMNAFTDEHSLNAAASIYAYADAAIKYKQNASN